MSGAPQVTNIHTDQPTRIYVHGIPAGAFDRIVLGFELGCGLFGSFGFLLALAGILSHLKAAVGL